MSKLSLAIYEIDNIEEMAQRKLWINTIHPLIKLIITVFYIFIVVSFHKYNIYGLIPMCIYPVFVFLISDTHLFGSLKQLRIVLPLVILMGIVNPFFDHSTYLIMDGFVITGGMISAITLMLKGILTVFASYLLIVTTNIESICYALRCLHIPEVFVTQMLLTYRYIRLLLVQANTITQAYALRAPNQKGIKYKVWGSLIGQLLFRSIDRATDLYDSMVLRGYKGEFFYARRGQVTGREYLYLFIWIALFILFKYVNLVNVIGNLFLF